jgi:hypothetical protein
VIETVRHYIILHDTIDVNYIKTKLKNYFSTIFLRVFNEYNKKSSSNRIRQKLIQNLNLLNFLL